MNYLERNQLVIAEMGQKLRLERGKLIADHHGFMTDRTTTVTSLGHYPSELLRGEVYVGLKEYSNKSKRTLPVVVATDLAIIHGAEQYVPQLLPEFPIFYGLLARSNGEPLGVLTEDFSKGGKYKVKDMYDSDRNLPKELEALVGKRIDPYELATVCFTVNGQRRLGDFGAIHIALLAADWEEKYSFYDIMDSLAKYTLQSDDL